MTMTSGRAADLDDAGAATTTHARATPAEARAVAVSGMGAPRTSTFTSAAARTRPGLNVFGALLFAGVIMAVGVGTDSAFGDAPGPATDVAFVLACTLMAMGVHIRRLFPVVVAAPLVFAATLVAIAKLSGEAQGTRQLVLDVATALSLSAPVLFAGTALTIVIALVRLVGHRVRRHG